VLAVDVAAAVLTVSLVVMSHFAIRRMFRMQWSKRIGANMVWSRVRVVSLLSDNIQVWKIDPYGDTK
jgi:hypothetical protein